MAFDLTSPLPRKGVLVPVQTNFTGHTRVPLLALVTNNLSPMMRLFEDEIAFKVFRDHRRPWRDIELVDALNWKLNKSVILRWNDTPWTFTAGLIVLPRLVEVLRFMERKQVPLSSRAARLLDEN